jgi:hypothetical protein
MYANENRRYDGVCSCVDEAVLADDELIKRSKK